MPAYVLLSRLNTKTQKEVVKNPAALKKIREVLEQWEATIIADFHLLGPHDHCTIFEVSDNFRAQRAVLNLEATSSPECRQRDEGKATGGTWRADYLQSK